MYTGVYSYPSAHLTAADKSSLGQSPFFEPRSPVSAPFDCNAL